MRYIKMCTALTGLIAASAQAVPITCEDHVDRMQRAISTHINKVYDLQATQIQFDPYDLCEQLGLENAFEFDAAFALALKQVFFNNQDRGSPLALVMSWLGEDGGKQKNHLPFESLEDRARKRLHRFVNKKTTVLSLLPLGELAEYGESVFNNWIFKLKIPEFSDHIYWIVLDRLAEAPAQIYGLN